MRCRQSWVGKQVALGCAERQHGVCGKPVVRQWFLVNVIEVGTLDGYVVSDVGHLKTSG